jgi:phosphoribosylformylglycinamidine cyclo-ligase
MAITYRQAGVDIDAGDDLVERIKPLARATRIPEVFDDIGGFAGLCGLPAGIEEPLLVSGTDGVGTKLKVAFATGCHDTIGQDLVAMCVNDVVTCGARPLFFLDYFGCGRLELKVAEAVIKGIADGCKLAGCALIGGETAELPGMYPDGEYDLAGFSVGVVAKKKLLGPQRVRVGDRVLGVASTGLHSNGYSLARHVFEKVLCLGYDATVPELGRTVGESLLVPTRIYARQVQALLETIGEGLHALCHVTGGGIVGNLPRVLPQGTSAQIRMPPIPPLFQLLAKAGPIDDAEMMRTFNMGIGLVVVADERVAAAARRSLAEQGETVHDLGVIAADERSPEPFVELL